MLTQLFIKSLKVDFPDIDIDRLISRSSECQQYVVHGYDDFLFTVGRHPELFSKKMKIFKVEEAFMTVNRSRAAKVYKIIGEFE